MKTKNLFFVALIGLQGLLTTCKKEFWSDDRCPKGTVAVYEASKAYFYFKPGTWWIYRNTIRDTTDSFWVEYNYIYTLVPRQVEDEKRCFEQINTFICSAEFSKRNPKLPNHVNQPPILNIGLGGGGVGEIYYNTYSARTIDPYRMVFNQDGSLATNQGRAKTTLSRMDTLTLNGTLYKEVIFFNNTPDGVMVQGDWFYSAYIAKHIGYVQYIDLAGELWVLERYNIIQ